MPLPIRCGGLCKYPYSGIGCIGLSVLTLLHSNWDRDRTHSWVKGTRESFLTAGTIPSPNDEKLLTDLQHDGKEFKVKQMNPGQASGRTRWDFRDRIIIGARLRNGWADGSNADWRLREGWPGEHAMEIEFKCKLSHGCDWGFEVWSLPEELCRR